MQKKNKNTHISDWGENEWVGWQGKECLRYFWFGAIKNLQSHIESQHGGKLWITWIVKRHSHTKLNIHI